MHDFPTSTSCTCPCTPTCKSTCSCKCTSAYKCTCTCIVHVHVCHETHAFTINLTSFDIVATVFPTFTTMSFDFQITTMPPTRPANYYLCCLNGSVFIDFNNDGNKVVLVRISFDGFGCCHVSDAIPVNENDSIYFKQMFQQNNIEQGRITEIILGNLKKNKSKIWEDALKRYHFIDE